MFFPFFTDNVILHSSEEFYKHEIIKPTLQHGRHKRDIADTRLEVLFSLFCFIVTNKLSVHFNLTRIVKNDLNITTITA